MKKIENKFTYNVIGGSVSGAFNVCQDNRGAVMLQMGNMLTELSLSQINDLCIEVYELIDFDYKHFVKYYNLK